MTGRVLVLGLWCVAACGGGADRASRAERDGEAGAGGAGATIYGSICITCHQATGEGLPGTLPPPAESPVVQGPAELPIKIVLHGLVGRMDRGGSTYNAEMTAWGVALTDQDVADVLTYVRSQFGNSAAAVTAAEVATIRAATASRESPFTTEELGIVH